MEGNERNTEALRKRLHMKAFYMMLEIAVVLAIPAFLALGVSKYTHTSLGITVILLVVAFVLSWAIIISRVRKLRKELKAVDAEVKAQKAS